MSKLEKSLVRWVSMGFIDQRQADTIQQYETSHADNSWILYGLLVLGAIIISIGVISVIAANWQYIPPSVKLFMDFATLFITAMLAVYAFNRGKDILFEIILLFFMLLCLASIGLISQIYNTGGEFYQALMLWAVITFPVTLFARDKLVHMVVPFIWLGGFLFALANTMLYSPLFFQFHFNFLAVAMIMPLFCACLILLGERLSFQTGYVRALQAWFFISGFIALGIIESETASELSIYNIMAPYLCGYLLAILTAIGIISSRDYNKAQKSVLLLALAIFILSFHISIIMPDASLTYAVLTIAILGLIAIFIASTHHRRLFNLLLFFIGIRFLILYFQALGGLAMTGIGLIISGLIIICMTYLWHKYRTNIANWAERWMQ